MSVPTLQPGKKYFITVGQGIGSKLCRTYHVKLQALWKGAYIASAVGDDDEDIFAIDARSVLLAVASNDTLPSEWYKPTAKVIDNDTGTILFSSLYILEVEHVAEQLRACGCAVRVEDHRSPQRAALETEDRLRKKEGGQ
jgi:hypothetical protein